MAPLARHAGYVRDAPQVSRSNRARIVHEHLLIVEGQPELEGHVDGEQPDRGVLQQRLRVVVGAAGTRALRARGRARGGACVAGRHEGGPAHRVPLHGLPESTHPACCCPVRVPACRQTRIGMRCSPCLGARRPCRGGILQAAQQCAGAWVVRTRGPGCPGRRARTGRTRTSRARPRAWCTASSCTCCGSSGGSGGSAQPGLPAPHTVTGPPMGMHRSSTAQQDSWQRLEAEGAVQDSGGGTRCPWGG